MAGADPILLSLGSAVGVLAAVVQFLGLIRWPFLVQYLGRASAGPKASDARKEAADIVFQLFNRFLGVAVGEHLGFLFTGPWSILVGAAVTQTNAVAAQLRIGHCGWCGPGTVLTGVCRTSERTAGKSKNAHLFRSTTVTHAKPKPAYDLAVATKQHKSFCDQCGVTTNHVTSYGSPDGGNGISLVVSVQCTEHSDLPS